MGTVCAKSTLVLLGQQVLVEENQGGQSELASFTLFGEKLRFYLTDNGKLLESANQGKPCQICFWNTS